MPLSAHGLLVPVDSFPLAIKFDIEIATVVKQKKNKVALNTDRNLRRFAADLQDWSVGQRVKPSPPHP